MLLPWGGYMKRIACLLATLLIGAACFGQTENKENAQNAGLRVVARINLLDQTRPIPSVNIYTPDADGVFRITMVSNCTIGNDRGGSWSGWVTWTNELGISVPVEIAHLKADVSGVGTQFPLTFNAAKDT